MAEAENQTKVNETHGATSAKKRKGFWSNIFGRSDDKGKATDQAQQNNGGSFKNDATQVAHHVAVNEASKEIEKLLNNNGSGSQPVNAGTAPDTTAVSGALSSPTNWAKKMVDSAQQKLQNLG